MNSTEWLNYYRTNGRKRTEPQWHVPCPLAPSTQRALAHSLSHFQLGESGEGNFLLSCAAREVPDDAAYHEALKLFVAEEQEHARLLANLVQRFGGRKIRWHWTQSLFRFVRRALGLNFELQVLVIAELVGTAYYRLLHARSRDPVLLQVCDQILRDEAGHIDFHADWLGTSQLCFLPLERQPWKTRFQILFAVAARIAWFDHRYCLKSIGVNRRVFSREARRECIHFFLQLEHGNVAEPARTSRSLRVKALSQ
jgi:rubrerythrin